MAYDAGSFDATLAAAALSAEAAATASRNSASCELTVPAQLTAFIEEIVATAPEQERLEGWIMSEVEGGHVLPGLYPPNAENKARYEASKKK